jgi:subtilisin family serine protease
VAGSAAAVIDGDGTSGGVVGMAPEAELISCKALGANGSGSYSDVVKCLEHVWNTGKPKLQIANFSLGSAQDPGTTVKAAFDKAYADHVLIIAAAGNSGNPGGGGNNVIYPARYESVVAVAATDSNDRRASFSSTGPDVEVSAPGVSIWSTHLKNGYGTLSGTSMASPHAAGAAALRAGQSGAPTTASALRDELKVSTHLHMTAKRVHSKEEAACRTGKVSRYS